MVSKTAYCRRPLPGSSAAPAGSSQARHACGNRRSAAQADGGRRDKSRVLATIPIGKLGIPEGLSQGSCTCRDPCREAELPCRDHRKHSVLERIPVGKPGIPRGIVASTMDWRRSRSGSSASLKGLSQAPCTCRDHRREAQHPRGIVASTVSCDDKTQLSRSIP